MPIVPSSFTVVETLTLAARAESLISADALEVGRRGRAYLDSYERESLWSHQHAAVEHALAGGDVCVATSTASGKTLVFHLASLRRLEESPNARVLALYPTRALGEEQEERWKDALRRAGITGTVTRIDGSVPVEGRNALVGNARVVIATPDVVHSWFLSRLGDPRSPALGRFLSQLAVLVVDEVHAYTGVFGSNAAFLFRRLDQVVTVLGGRYQVVAASATIARPEVHFEKLLGRKARVVGAEEDGSPKHRRDVHFVRPESANFQGELESLFLHLRAENKRFIAFFDSRQMAERTAATVARSLRVAAPEGNEGIEAEPREAFDHLLRHDILPYRAGFEAEHRTMIQRRLSDGSLAGVLSTSALELGLDIPGLDVVVLVGTPASGTSLQQRIGRVGRHAPGDVVIIDTGSPSDEVAFASPESVLTRPLSDGAIHLESPRIQYIHALCFARPDGELNAASRLGHHRTGLPEFPAEWPVGFQKLCAMARAGEVPRDLRDLHGMATGEVPAHVFPLRDIERQFTITLARGNEKQKLGHLSFSQLMREAYPGAVYYHTGKPFRVTEVNVGQRRVSVQRCPFYTTQPFPSFEQVVPQRDATEAHRSGDLFALDCELKVRKAITGIRERRGSTYVDISYAESEYCHGRTFSREYFTTGVVIVHPALDKEGVEPAVVAALLVEAYLLVVPLDRQDVDGGSGVLAQSWGDLGAPRRFVSVHDQTFGSLRLSGQLLEEDALVRTLEVAVQLSSRDHVTVGIEKRSVTEPSRDALRELLEAARLPRSPYSLNGVENEQDRVRVLLPTSVASRSDRPNQTFEVQRVGAHPSLGVVYRGVWVHGDGRREQDVVPVNDVVGVPERSKWGTYDVEQDEVHAA